ncbi:hypothetical protein EOL94_01285 [bacterium]|nr:hypothetical protein [bacterium]
MVKNKGRGKLKIRLMIVVLSCLFLFLFIIFFINFKINKIGNNYCLETDNKQTALVLGAKVYSNGQMSSVFQDRVDTAIELYNNGRVKKILVSGDHGRENYDEVNSAKNYLLEKGVLKEDIFLDHAGFDTFDSVYRAKEIFQVDSLIIVTQNFHLPRALYIAKKLGIDSCGKIADKHIYVKQGYMNRREFLAKIKAWLDITFNSEPRYLGDVIPVTGESIKSWD